MVGVLSYDKYERKISWVILSEKEKFLDFSELSGFDSNMFEVVSKLFIYDNLYYFVHFKICGLIGGFHVL